MRDFEEVYNMKYLDWYEEEQSLFTKNGEKIRVLNLNAENNDEVLNEWAEHFRNNYRTLEDLDFDIEDTGKSREEFLINDVFPDTKVQPGPATRVGDFCELLVADYIEFICNYYVPRTRYCRKINRNMSSPGSDVMGFKINEKSPYKDEAFVLEVKGTADPKSGKKGYKRLQDAIDGSEKDILRYSESLNAVKRRLKDSGETDKAKMIGRFQNYADKPYVIKYGASAVLTNSIFIADDMINVTTENHKVKNLELIVIHNNGLKELIDELYRRAAKC